MMLLIDSTKLPKLISRLFLEIIGVPVVSMKLVRRCRAYIFPGVINYPGDVSAHAR